MTGKLVPKHIHVFHGRESVSCVNLHIHKKKLILKNTMKLVEKCDEQLIHDVKDPNKYYKILKLQYC